MHRSKERASYATKGFAALQQALQYTSVLPFSGKKPFVRQFRPFGGYR